MWYENPRKAPHISAYECSLAGYNEATYSKIAVITKIQFPIFNTIRSVFNEVDKSM